MEFGTTTTTTGFIQDARRLKLLLPAALSVLALGGCASDMDIPGLDADERSLGGELQGLGDGEIALDLNGDETLALPANGPFSFDTTLMDGTDYEVSIETQPANQACTVANGAGTVAGEAVDDVLVECVSSPSLSARPDVMQLHLAWDAPDAGDTVDIKYSADPDCDWDNYASCDDAGMLADMGGGELSLGAIEDDLDPDTSYFFVAEANGLRSEKVGVRAPAPTLYGQAEAVLVDGDWLYVGGSFDTLSPMIGGGLTVRADNGELTGPTPLVEGRYRTIVDDGEGGWYVAGDFSAIAGHERSSIARLRPDGSLDPDWEAAIDGDVHAMALADGRLFVGGEFALAGNPGDLHARENLAAFDAESGELETNWTAGTSSYVYAMLVGEGRLYVGGRFNEAGEPGLFEPREGLAVFDTESGDLSSGWTGQLNDDVRDLHLDGDRLFVGGEFNQAGEPGSMETRQHLAVFDAASGDLDPDWDSGADNRVRSVDGDDERLYIGGYFLAAGPDGSFEARDYLAAFELSSGELVSDWSPSPDDRVTRLAVSDDRVYVGGEFVRLDGERQPYVVAIAKASGERDPSWQVSVDDEVSTIHEAGDLIFVGGWFDGAGSVPANGLARLDAATGVVDTDWMAGVDYKVNALAIDAGRLYVGGDFEQAGSGPDAAAYDPHHYLVAFDVDSGEIAADWNDNDAWSSDIVHLNVRDVVVADNKVYAGGVFSEIDGVSRTSLAAFDPVTGAVDGSWDAAADGTVFALAVSDGYLIAGGTFTEAGNGSDATQYDARNRLAAFDLSTGQFDNGWDAGVSGTVFSMTAVDGRLFVGGYTSTAGNGTDTNTYDDVYRVAEFDAGTGVHDASWPPGVDNSFGTFSTNTILVHDGFFHVGGDFDLAGENGSFEERENLAVFDFDTGALLGPNPQPDRRVNALAAGNGRLYLGGSFRVVGGDDPRPRRGLAAVDEQTGELIW